MAGLLDGMLDSDSLRLGLGLLAAGGPTTDPNRTGIGQRLQEGIGSFDAYKANALKQKMLEAQMQQAMEQAAQQKADRARQQTIQQGMGQFFKPGQQALAPLMGDAATGIMPSAGKAAIAPSFDSAGASSFLAQNGEYEQALKLMPKPKELQVNKLDVKDFTPESVQKFAQTGSYADLVRMDKAHFGDSGGQLVAMNPFTGQPLNSINKTQSPDSKASNAVAWANNAATLRGQNMIDGRARDLNDITRGEKKKVEDLTKGSQIASFDTMLGTLDRLGKHPGLSRSVGMVGAFPTMPGSESANFKAELDTFQSQAFIPMVSQLKGMGALSDAEGKKLTAAVGALNPAMGEKAFRESIDRITTEMEAARQRVSGQPSPKPSPSKVPMRGQVVQGYKYKGGDPADQSNWEKQ